MNEGLTGLEQHEASSLFKNGGQNFLLILLVKITLPPAPDATVLTSRPAMYWCHIQTTFPGSELHLPVRQLWLQFAFVLLHSHTDIHSCGCFSRLCSALTPLRSVSNYKLPIRNNLFVLKGQR
ncbi:hypothetical protein F2P79_010818 [Pimephales promelas]|nr:hypothetical protein F2P79_010818 [Pimephales promelas]